MVLAVHADEGRIRVAFNAQGELPDGQQLALIEDQIRGMVQEVLGRRIDVEIEVRPWQRGDGSDLVDWRSALRRWASR